MGTTFIYALCEPDTGEVRYVGKANDPLKRFRKHLNEKREKNHRACWVRSLVLTGRKPLLEILDEVPVVEWPQWEVAYIQLFREQGCDLVNGSLGGEGNPGLKVSQETREKLRAALVGRHLSEEHRRSISAAQTGISRGLGRVIPTEVRAKISAALSGEKSPLFGIKRSAEVCAKISVATTGRTISEEQRKKHSVAMTGENNPNYGKKRSAEVCEKIRTTLLQRAAKKKGQI